MFLCVIDNKNAKIQCGRTTHGIKKNGGCNLKAGTVPTQFLMRFCL